MLDHLRQSFLEETRELLGQLEESLLELEGDRLNSELISKVFRILHTIKGSAGMFEFEDITKFTHDIENVFDLIRNGEIPADKYVISLTLRAKDHIEKLLNEDENISNEETLRIVEAYKKIMREHDKEGLEEKDLSGEKAGLVPGNGIMTFLIEFRPHRNILQNGTNPLLLINELKDLGDCRLNMITDGIPPFSLLDPEKCYVYWNILLRTEKGIDAIKDVFIFVEDDCELKISPIDDTPAGNILQEYYEDVSRILFENSPDMAELLRSLSNKKPKQSFSESSSLPAPSVNSKQGKTGSEAGPVSSIRVSSEKLDCLVNLVGELVTVQARLSQIASGNNDPEIISISEEVERLTCELRDNTLGIRMVPIRSTFNRFKRLIRDLSEELGKKVELFTEGEETELDKNVIDKLNDPLVHIIRNSIDHGIEATDIRVSNGKPEAGCVILSAGYAGSNVVIRITDDGAGLNKEAIRKKAIEKGLINKDSILTEKELCNLVFAPGFSTAEKVSSVSGRGVGMDVVKKTIETLRGTIELSSEYGIGTTITLKLPLTLAIIEGLLVQIGNDYFIIPLAAVEECIELKRNEVQNENGMNLVNVRGELVPYVPLRERFNIFDCPQEIEQVVITNNENSESNGSSKTGFVVDKVIGEHQTVIKSLGKFYKEAEGISGATILGDGTLALILDIPALLKREEELERQLFIN